MALTYEFYGRKMSVIIGDDDNAIEIKESFRDKTQTSKVNLKMTAKIVKDGKTGDDDFCEISIYNLSEPTRALFNTTYTRMVLSAGYGEHDGIIFVGDIQSATHIIEGQNWITRVIASDGAKALDQALINKTYKAGTTMGDMITDFKNIAGIDEFSLLNLDVDKVLERGKTINGMFRENMTEIGDANGFDWSIQDGRIVAVDTKVSRQAQRIVFSAETGMIGSPEWINSGTSKSKVESESGNKLKLVSLCQPTVRPFDKIFVKSVTLSGQISGVPINIVPTQLVGEFKVLKVTHSLDSYEGDFTTTIECELTGNEFISPEEFNISKLIQGGSE